jgi:hypothetical protein
MNRKKGEKAAKAIQGRFIRQYVRKKPYAPYVNGCGLSKVGLSDRNQAVKGDFCIIVRLLRPLPRNLKLPSQFEGMKVLARVVGPVRSL